MVNIGSVSKKWSNDILFSLNDGPKRYNQLMDLTGEEDKKINSRALANGLKQLEKEGLISREIINERPPTTLYKITSKGKKVLELLYKIEKL